MDLNTDSFNCIVYSALHPTACAWTKVLVNIYKATHKCDPLFSVPDLEPGRDVQSDEEPQEQ